MTVVVRWEDPPPNKSGGHKAPRRTQYWRDVAAELRAHPDKWAVVLEGDNWSGIGGMSSAITAGRLAAFRPDGAFQAQTRTTPAGFTIYARYVGGAE